MQNKGALDFCDILPNLCNLGLVVLQAFFVASRYTTPVPKVIAPRFVFGDN
jgi:hypothetical protein